MCVRECASRETLSTLRDTARHQGHLNHNIRRKRPKKGRDNPLGPLALTGYTLRRAPRGLVDRGNGKGWNAGQSGHKSRLLWGSVSCELQGTRHNCRTSRPDGVKYRVRAGDGPAPPWQRGGAGSAKMGVAVSAPLPFLQVTLAVLLF